jgi:transposase-like protein
MENQQNQRLLYDTECKDCNQKSICEFADTTQCCRKVTDKLRDELGKNRKTRKPREIIAKISITTDYIFNTYKEIKTVADKGTFVLKEPYIFGELFLRAEITGENDGGTFSTKYYGWNNIR